MGLHPLCLTAGTVPGLMKPIITMMTSSTGMMTDTILSMGLLMVGLKTATALHMVLQAVGLTTGPALPSEKLIVTTVKAIVRLLELIYSLVLELITMIPLIGDVILRIAIVQPMAMPAFMDLIHSTDTVMTVTQMISANIHITI
ncbi:hypothetical protein ABVT39_011608 [Epinephelus coioides]